MTLNEVKEYANSIDEEIIIFESPSYSNSIVGITNDNRVIYDYDLMIEDLVEEEGMSYEDAVDFIHYNTLWTYYDSKQPIILFIK